MKKVIKRLLQIGIPIPGFVTPLIRALYNAGVIMVEGSAFIRKLFWIEPVLKAVCRSVGKGLRAECLPYIRGSGHLTLGENVHLTGRSGFCFVNGMPEMPEIVIGSGTFIGHKCALSAARRICIGDKCLIAAGVRIHDNDGHPLDPGRRLRNEPIRQAEAAEVVIGNNVWIGAQAIILKGVTIGDDAVVGAMAVVTTAVPARALVVGNPARVVKMLVEPI